MAFGVIALFALFGQRILDYLHVSLAALQGAGGLLLLLVALQLLTGQEQESMADAGVNVAMVPLGTPLLAGPGAIVAMMLAVQQAGASTGVAGYSAVGLALLGHGVVYLFLRFATVVDACSASPGRCSPRGSRACCSPPSRSRWSRTRSGPSSRRGLTGNDNITCR